MKSRSLLALGSFCCFVACGGRELSAGTNEPPVDAGFDAARQPLSPTADCPLLLYKGSDIDSPRALVIGLLAPLTGPNALVGSAITTGAAMASDEIVGVLPYPIVVLACDDQQNVAASVRHLIDDLRVPLVIGPSDLAHAQIVASLVRPAGVATILPMLNDPLLQQIPGEKGLAWQMRGDLPATLGPELGSFTIDLRSRYPEWISKSVPADALYTHDSVLVAAYGLVAAGPSPTLLSGRDFARGMARVTRGERTVRLTGGVNMAALEALAKGSTLRLEGAAGPLDWDANGVP